MNFAEIQDALNEIRDNQDQSRTGFLFRQWHGCCEKFVGYLLSHLIKERARAIEAEHKFAAYVGQVCGGLAKHDLSPDDCNICAYTPADWEREAEKELRKET